MAYDWEPGASPEMLRARDRLLRVVRSFFSEKGVIEVQTPVVGTAGASDPHIENLTFRSSSRTLYLQTSPEYAMKRLLAGGSGAIFQVCPALRGGESGERHNMEFTMLEWYRPGFNLGQLADEVVALIERAAVEFSKPLGDVRSVSYRELFESCYGRNPHACDSEDLAGLVKEHHGGLPAHLGEADAGTVNDLLDYLFSRGIEKSLEGPTVVFNFPTCQAALAEVVEDQDSDEVAARFELFWQGTELANGYLELRKPEELRARIVANNDLRRQRGMQEMPADEKLLEALPEMPVCSGVALGIDRLLMLLTDAVSIDEVLAFSDHRI
jgi:lysyl-tRNA synthetase class 2